MDYEWPQAGSPELCNFLQTLQIGCLKLSSYSKAGSAYKHACPLELHSGTAAESSFKSWLSCAGLGLLTAPSTSCLWKPGWKTPPRPWQWAESGLKKMYPAILSLTHSFTKNCWKALWAASPGPEVGVGWRGVNWKLFDGITIGDPRNTWILPFTTTITTLPLRKPKEQEQKRNQGSISETVSQMTFIGRAL